MKINHIDSHKKDNVLRRVGVVFIAFVINADVIGQTSDLFIPFFEHYFLMQKGIDARSTGLAFSEFALSESICGTQNAASYMYNLPNADIEIEYGGDIHSKLKNLSRGGHFGIRWNELIITGYYETIDEKIINKDSLNTRSNFGLLKIGGAGQITSNMGWGIFINHKNVWSGTKILRQKILEQIESNPGFSLSLGLSGNISDIIYGGIHTSFSLPDSFFIKDNDVVDTAETSIFFDFGLGLSFRPEYHLKVSTKVQYIKCKDCVFKCKNQKYNFFDDVLLGGIGFEYYFPFKRSMLVLRGGYEWTSNLLVADIVNKQLGTSFLYKEYQRHLISFGIGYSLPYGSIDLAIPFTIRSYGTREARQIGFLISHSVCL